MGKRGPIPRSARENKLRGNPGKRKLPEEDEQVVPGVSLACPKHLPDEAKAFWNQIAPKLAEQGLLTELDHFAFEQLCRTYASWQRYEKLADESEFPESRWASYALKYSQLFHRLAADFGLSPTSRARIGTRGITGNTAAALEARGLLG